MSENPIDELTRLFERFPGIGPRQARRFVHYLLGQSTMLRNTLAAEIKALGSHTAICPKCFRWFPSGERRRVLCAICGSKTRDSHMLFVLEKDSDIDNVERSGFTGLYFVLGGVVPLAEEHPEKFIRIGELLKRVSAEAKNGLKEIILGLSATAEGDHTRLLLQEKLLPIAKEHSFVLSSLGRGLSTGSELEYADPETISQALGSRH